MVSASRSTAKNLEPVSRTLICADEAATSALGRALAPALGPGDLVALSGPLGAGKSYLARAMIRAALGEPEAQVASPSYTLVNVYKADPIEIWHADLYRLSDAEELVEVGLEDAARDSILLVEWAERWSPLPPRHLSVTLNPHPDDAREITIEAVGPGWARALAALEQTGALT